VSSFVATALHLLWTFSQLSVLGFGGGKGIIPQMHHEAVAGYHWVSNTQFTQFYTIGKLVPGPTTIFAALVGYAAMPGHAWLGALIATIGMFVPSSAIMVVADAYWARFEGSAWRAIVSRGLAPAIVGLVWSSVLTIGRGAPGGPLAYAVTGIVAIVALRTTLSAPLLISLSGIVGIIALR
jgi:chromate transporter